MSYTWPTAPPDARAGLKPSDSIGIQEESIKSSRTNIGSSAESKDATKNQEFAIDTVLKSVAVKDTSSDTTLMKLPISDTFQKPTANTLFTLATGRVLKKMRIFTKAKDAGSSRLICIMLQQTGARFNRYGRWWNTRNDAHQRLTRSDHSGLRSHAGSYSEVPFGG
ncbi:hypothetical protein B2J93_2244 [Marssonina coronariae]|uniref:Uncharacterized protein n=1 Tax=Diplocarpon coronariae TaxID=2795749 RepID=A0A218YV71_9HELO|nr:hypothetical protein B2J93_2244 [Marssonina coronariae]